MNFLFIACIMIVLMADSYATRQRLDAINDTIGKIKQRVKAESEQIEKQSKIETKRIQRMEEIIACVKTEKASIQSFEEIAFCALFETYSWTTKEEWIYTLITQYPAEVVKEYGRNLKEIRSELSWLWECNYKDEMGFEYKFSEWAKMFNNKPAIQVYLHLLYEKNSTNENVINLVSERQRNLYDFEDFA